MAFSNDIVLDDLSGDDVTFTLVAPDPKKGGSRRIDASSVAPENAYLLLNNQVQGAGDALVDAYLVSITDTQVAASGVKKTMVINLSTRIPQDPVFTMAVIKDRLYELKNFLTEANIEKLLRGEI